MSVRVLPGRSSCCRDGGAWLGPAENGWIAYLAFVVLAIPFCAVSIFVEGHVARGMLPHTDPRKVMSWVTRANVMSYSLMIAAAMLYPLSPLGTAQGT